MVKKKVLIVYGTRPEFIKLMSLIELLRAAKEIEVVVINTGQHRELVKALEEAVDIRADIYLDIMMENQSPNHVISKTITLFEEILDEHEPDLVIIQGDTTTVLSVGICCFNRKVKVGHVEAGLRSFNIDSPFPEEFNRRVVSMFASYHFAPTSLAAENLRKEGIPGEKIFMTGNTVIDALRMIDDRLEKSVQVKKEAEGKKIILVTAHRRENYGDGIHGICEAIRKLRDTYEDIEFVWPVHPNPNIKDKVYEKLAGLSRIRLIAPLSYLELVGYLKTAYLVLTDSGGIQEEVPYFKKPVIVLRNETERPEVLHAGFGVLAGTDTQRIIEEVSVLLEDEQLYKSRVQGENPFGDGKAANRIIKIIQH